jgi:tripartite-type tricarboxylate transporter receptor subunit TctC
MKRFPLIVAALLAAAASAVTQASAPTYPTKPVRIIVPFPAAGTVDQVARILQPKLAEFFGQSVLIENKAGAGGTVGAAEVAKAAPDGHTLLVVFDTHAVNHHLYKLSYDTFKSLDHLMLIVTSPMLVIGAPNFGPANIPEVVAYAKANPGSVTYGSVGTGSSNHLNALILSSRAGIEMTHVPYKGGAPMLQDTMGGNINLTYLSAPLGSPQVRGGKVKGLAVGSQKRMTQLPDVPTLAETFPGMEAITWVGLLAPAGMPKDVRARIHREFTRALHDPDINKRLKDAGFDVVGGSSEEFLRFVQRESDKLGKVIRDNKIKVE